MVTSRAPDGGLDDARVAVVDGSVEDDLGKGPGAAVVAGADELDPAVGADVSFSAAGVGNEQLTRAAAGEGRPAVIVLGLLADGGGRLGGGAEGGGGCRGCEKRPAGHRRLSRSR